MRYIRSFLIVFAVAAATPAHADALDGDWCSPNYGKLTIEGSTILTPAGKQVTGAYSRHRFDYVAPDGDWNGGKQIVIQQFSEELMELTAGDGQPNQWKRCHVTS